MNLMPQYEAYSYLVRNDQRVTAPRRIRAALSPKGRFWTRGGAERYARQITNNPQVLARSLESALHTYDGSMVFCHYEIRRAKDGAVVGGTDDAA